MLDETGQFESPGKAEAAMQTPAMPEASGTKTHKFPDCQNG